MKKLRILQVNKLYSPWIGGIESVVKDTAASLNSRTDMKVLVCQPKGRGVTENVEGISVIRASSLGMKFSMPISVTFPFLVRKCSRNADVIILHDPFPLGDLAVLLSGTKAKVVVWWHSDIVKQKKLRKLIDPMIHGLLKRADAIFTTTEGYIGGSAYISKYRDKCRLVPYGIDTGKYLNAERKPLLTDLLTDREAVKVLFTGRLVYYKGVGVLMDAFRDVKGAELFIIGTGADEDELRKAAGPMGDRVHFMGNLSDDDLKAAFADCDIFVLPSIEKSEAFGIVQLEAMVYGKPVINTDLDTSVPYVSLDGITGLTVHCGDAKDLADAINKLVNDSALREEYGRNARKRVEEQFEIHKTADNIMKQLTELTGIDGE
ncbi:MAG: glycosyltransferase [Huintestinicola sp.]